MPAQVAQSVDRLLQAVLVAGLAAGAAVDDRDADLRRGLEGLLHLGRVLRRLLHRQQLQAVRLRQALDLRRELLPAVQHQVLAHAVDGRELDAVVAGHGQVLEGGLHVVAAEEDGIGSKFH